MYKYYNANSLGRLQEDCTVRSISCATGKSWDYVYSQLSNEARNRGTMMDNRDFIIEYLDSRYESVDVEGMSVGEVSAMYSDCIVLITMSNHITCSKFGTIYDTFDPRYKRAEFCWIVR